MMSVPTRFEPCDLTRKTVLLGSRLSSRVPSNETNRLMFLTFWYLPGLIITPIVTFLKIITGPGPVTPTIDHISQSLVSTPVGAISLFGCDFILYLSDARNGSILHGIGNIWCSHRNVGVIVWLV